MVVILIQVGMEDLNSCSDVHSQKPKSEQNPDIKASVKRAPLHPNESLTPFRVLVIGQGVSGYVPSVY